MAIIVGDLLLNQLETSKIPGHNCPALALVRQVGGVKERRISGSS
jgi:hypothetical protein